MSLKVNKFQNIRIDLLPATKCGKTCMLIPTIDTFIILISIYLLSTYIS